MKSLKKTLVLLVVFSMILSAVMPAFAATDVYGLDCEEEVTRLEALGVVTGVDAEGTFAPEETITRAQMAVILCKMVGISEVTAEENKVVPSKFSDVKVGEWYTGFVNVAAGKDLLSGFPDGTFRPNEQLTMNQVLTLCVNALGRGEYVAEMGAWPANYIAEATKLGLLDGVKTAEANRGNVAIIVWNTLEAPYVWDVTNTEYEGTINLGDSTRSLLSIYFRDFSYDAGTYKNDKFVYADRLLKEADYVEVTAVPSTNGDLGENQFVLAKTADTTRYFESLLDAIEEDKKPRGTDDEEWTSVNKANEIVAYAPEFNNLNSYFGKVVTVIFGEDNKVVSVRVIDETVEDEYLTAWEDKKLEIAGNSYKFADNAKVYINTVEMTNEAYEGVACDCGTTTTTHTTDCAYEPAVAATTAAGAMTKIGTILINGKTDSEGNALTWDWEDYNKVIKANVSLDSKGKVARLDLFVSGDYAAIGTAEAVVEKVRNEEITLDDNETIDYSEDVDEDDLPRVFKNNVVVEVSEIAVGDVLTYFYEVDADGDKEIKTIYVSSNKVEGEITRASKEDYRLTVNGEKYYSSMEELVVTNDKIADAKSIEEVDKYIGENVELYLNVYGEYVLMVSEEAEETWVFGVITRVSDEEDGEEDNIFYKDIRVLLADGTTARNYKFVYDTEDEQFGEDDWNKITKADLQYKFVVFAPDANGEIALDDYEVIELSDSQETKIADGDYEVMFADDASATVDDDRERIEAKVFADSTVIFNLRSADSDPETTKSWKVLTNNDALAQDALLIFEEDSKTLSYVLIDVASYATSDAQYAIVVTDDYKEKRGTTTKKYTELLTLDGTEEFEAKELEGKYTLGLEEMFVEYALSGDKLARAAKLIDLPALKALKASKLLGTEITESTETKLLVDLFAAGEKVVKHGTVANTPGANEVLLATVEANAETDYTPAVGDVVVLDTTYGLATETELADDSVTKLTVVADTVACDGTCGSTACTGIEYNVEGAIKANLKVVDTQNLLIEYEDDENEVEASLGEVIVDEDVIVLDARGGKLVETTFNALRNEVKEDGYVYVVPFANKDAAGYYSDPVQGTVQTDISKIEANILVIVD